MTTQLLLTGTLLASSLTGSIISSADPTVSLDSGSVVYVQGPPDSHAPFVWPRGFTYLSNQDSGYGGSNLIEPLGVAFQAYEPFFLQSDGVLHLIGFGDDMADFSTLSVGTLASVELGSGDFIRPLTATVNLSAGDYYLVVTAYNNHANAPGNYTSVAWKGEATSAVPEPTTVTMLSLALLVGGTVVFYRRGKA